MVRNSILATAVVVAMASGISAARAQDVQAVERIGRDRPLLVPVSEGPRARVNELRFVEHAGTTWLLAASSDKLVHRWKVDDEGRLTRTTPLRWPLFRGLRGSIYTLEDVGRGLVAIAGVGVKSSQVTLLHVDGETQPRRLVDVTQGRQNVWSLSADRARRILYVGEGDSGGGTANLLAWTVGEATPRVVCCATNLADVKHVAVSPDGLHVVAAGPLSNRKSWGAFVWSTGALFQHARSPSQGGAAVVAPVQQATFDSEWPDSIRGIDWLDDRTWIAGTVLGYMRGAVGGAVDKAGFEHAKPKQWQVGVFFKPGTEGTFTVSNSLPMPITLVDEAANNARTQVSEGGSATFGGNASIARVRDREAKVGPFAAAGLAGWEMAFVPYVVDLDCEPASNLVLSSVWDDSRAVTVLEQRGADGVVAKRTPLRPSVFRDVTAMALSPDGRFAAAAGPELVTVDEKEVAVQHLRVWSTSTGDEVARFPDAEAPAVGGPIASVVTSQVGPRDTIVYEYGILPNIAKDGFRIYPGVVDAQESVPAGDVNVAFAAKAARNFPNSNAEPRVPGEIDVLTGAFRESITGRGMPVVRFSMGNRAGSDKVGPFFTKPENLPQCCVTFSQNGRRFAAVGLLDGIQVWDLAECEAGRGYRALARSYYGHDGAVMSIDVSTDGTQLYSGSTDGTICGWSLRDLRRTAELGLATNGTTITGVTERLAGYYAGFETGMTVTGLRIQGHAVPANQLAGALREPLPGCEYFFDIRSGNQAINLQTPIAHDPLWTFYPRHDGQSVMWTPEGYFDTSELNGTDSIEWVVSLVGPLGQSDRVVVMAGVDQGGSRFRDSRVLDEVFRRSLRAADNLPIPPSIQLAGDGEGCSFSARPVGGGQTIARLELFLNGRLLQESNGTPIRLDANTLATAVRSGKNTMAGVVETTVGGEAFRFRQLLDFQHTSEPRPRRTHFVGVAVESAPGKDPLPTVVDDVTLIADAIAANRLRLGGRTHPVVEFADADPGLHEVLTGRAGQEPPTAANVRSALGKLVAAVAPDDLAIIVLSSHGELKDGEYVFHTTDQPMRQDEISRLIERLPCRTLLILDTCHAGGGAGKSQQIEQFARVVNGPMVLTACAEDEEAHFEKFELKHGFFLAAVAEGLSGRRIARPPFAGGGDDVVADLDGDGWLVVEEFARYVQSRTGEIKKQYFAGNAPQTPQVLSSVFFADSRETPLR